MQAIGRHGAAALLEAATAAAAAAGRDAPEKGGLRVLTHCNTGALATAAYGTALGVVRALAAGVHLEHVYCTETRPYNQGPLHSHQHTSSIESAGLRGTLNALL